MDARDDDTDYVRVDVWHGFRVGDRVRFMAWGTQRQDPFVIVEIHVGHPLGPGTEMAVATIKNDRGEIHGVNMTEIAPALDWRA